MNTIGIDHNLDWPRIRHLLKIGLMAAFLVLIGDMLLGYGITDESLTGPEQLLSKYETASAARIAWSALLGLIGIPLEGLSYFAIYRLMADGSMKHAHVYRSGIFGILIFGGGGVHVPCCALVYYYQKMLALHPAAAISETLSFALYFLLPATVIFLIFLIILIAAQISAFAKGVTPLPKWCWIFSPAMGIVCNVLLKLAGNHAFTNALMTGWISLGNLWTFGGLLLVTRRYAGQAQTEKPEQGRKLSC